MGRDGFLEEAAQELEHGKIKRDGEVKEKARSDRNRTLRADFTTLRLRVSRSTN